MTDDPLAALKASFRIRTLQDADALDDALSRGDEGRREIERLAHGLAGSAGIFGQQDISVAAATIDICFAEGGVPRAQWVRALSATIRERLGDHS